MLESVKYYQFWNENMLIPHQDISEIALAGLAKDYVISQLSETELELDVGNWTNKVIERVKKGELVIEYSENDESVSLKKREDIVGSMDAGIG